SVPCCGPSRRCRCFCTLPGRWCRTSHRPSGHNSCCRSRLLGRLPHPPPSWLLPTGFLLPSLPCRFASQCPCSACTDYTPTRPTI
ncbi:unnamed protein product, partial [Symbiodinium pilosum]